MSKNTPIQDNEAILFDNISKLIEAGKGHVQNVVRNEYYNVKGKRIPKNKNPFKNPLVLDFLGLKSESAYSESKLETAIISKLQYFLLEMGKGFLFEARQKKIHLR